MPYGVERWLAELALALRQETYRPEPIIQNNYLTGKAPYKFESGYLQR
jgi:hypothetical protein